VEDVRLPVERVDGLYLQHDQSPEY
jgi:hypothetical protein